ncbi:helix-turn-helix domain-containing protein [Ruminococcus sp. OA3]|uniref:sugar diacid recognition domain-containing protein n=1 Tax=Ruminococcus sp. OA3 TaxID=2914164 RepID=UPI001F059E1D|nr:sugar diacid recognition domain-containing protein [Ruminococcus sp. OA3]MCH1981749.1 helix-turn-helix domain-containing protein [Ruminococcus sp. OA3]
MLEKEFAQRFIEKISEYTDLKFMVFNTEGIIIAATEKERVGVFHEASYNMITQGLPYIVVHPQDVKKYLGVKNGVDMTIMNNNRIVGGIGITGIPEEVMDIITMAKITIEAMLEHEVYKEEMDQKNNERDEFCSLLLKSDSKDTDKIHLMARHQMIDPGIPRFAVIFEVIDEDCSRQNVLDILYSSPGFTQQDIAFISKRQEIVLFKSMDRPLNQIFTEYKNHIRDFLIPVYEKLLKKQIPCQYYIGSMQNKLENYKFSYRHCTWLRDYENPRCYFYDYMNEYIQSQIPALEMYGVFNSLGDLMSDSLRQDFVEIITALNCCNYNLVESSRSLHIHKNTLIFHLNKIKELYNINPLQDGEDRAFTDYLCRYLKSRK